MLTKKGLDEQTMEWNQRSNNYYLQRRRQHRPPALLIIILTVDNARLQQPARMCQAGRRAVRDKLLIFARESQDPTMPPN
ncbi:unnamed protein product [Lasius platythorax]|uniref:Uncharacterized protein n=1 Tax=Lasius platythorax TaxID=488582 RepID=A0AAV2P9H6_9HYME